MPFRPLHPPLIPLTMGQSGRWGSLSTNALAMEDRELHSEQGTEGTGSLSGSVGAGREGRRAHEGERAGCLPARWAWMQNAGGRRARAGAHTTLIPFYCAWRAALGLISPRGTHCAPPPTPAQTGCWSRLYGPWLLYLCSCHASCHACSPLPRKPTKAERCSQLARVLLFLLGHALQQRLPGRCAWDKGEAKGNGGQRGE